MTRLTLTRLTPALGAIVDDVDLSNATDALRDDIRVALAHHQVLFFRGQRLSAARHRDFAAGFGDLHVHPIYPPHPDAREIMVLDNAVFDLQDNAIWHTDVTFTETPPRASILAAHTLPETGGDTLWGSGFAAYDALSGRVKAQLDGLTAQHDFTKSFPLKRFGVTAEDRARWEKTRATHPSVAHPVVRTHPETGRKTLFVNEVHDRDRRAARRGRRRAAALPVRASVAARVHAALALAAGRRRVLGQPLDGPLRGERLRQSASGDAPRDDRRRQAVLSGRRGDSGEASPAAGSFVGRLAASFAGSFAGLRIGPFIGPLIGAAWRSVRRPARSPAARRPAIRLPRARAVARVAGRGSRVNPRAPSASRAPATS